MGSGIKQTLREVGSGCRLSSRCGPSSTWRAGLHTLHPRRWVLQPLVLLVRFPTGTVGVEEAPAAGPAGGVPLAQVCLASEPRSHLGLFCPTCDWWFHPYC